MAMNLSCERKIAVSNASGKDEDFLMRSRLETSHQSRRMWDS